MTRFHEGSRRAFRPPMKDRAHPDTVARTMALAAIALALFSLAAQIWMATR